MRDRKKKPTAIAMVMSGRSAKAGAQPHAESGGATGCQSHQDEGWDSLESVNSLVWSQGSILDDRLHYDYYMHDYGKILEDTGRYWKPWFGSFMEILSRLKHRNTFCMDRL